MDKKFYTRMEMVFEQIQDERAKQFDKWGDQSNLNDFEWLAVLTEEVGELAEATLHTKFGGKAKGMKREELIHVAAVAVQWLETFISP